MMEQKEMTALNPSVGADEEQSNNEHGNSITDYGEKCNSFEANYENDFDYQNEKLKAKNQMLWVQKMNNIDSRATEMVNAEIIFA